MEKIFRTLRFADDVAQRTESVKDIEHRLNSGDGERLKIGHKMHKKNQKKQFLDNIDTADSISIDVTEVEKVTNCKYLGQSVAIENRTRKEISMRINAG